MIRCTCPFVLMLWPNILVGMQVLAMAVNFKFQLLDVAEDNEAPRDAANRLVRDHHMKTPGLTV